MFSFYDNFYTSMQWRTQDFELGGAPNIYYQKSKSLDTNNRS